MEWDVIAPMLTAMVLFVTIGGVLVLRPLSKRLAELLESMARERNRESPQLEAEFRRMREVMETMASRLELLEERQDFTERLLTERSRGSSGEEGKPQTEA